MGGELRDEDLLAAITSSGVATALLQSAVIVHLGSATRSVFGIGSALDIEEAFTDDKPGNVVRRQLHAACSNLASRSHRLRGCHEETTSMKSRCERART